MTQQQQRQPGMSEVPETCAACRFGTFAAETFMRDCPGMTSKLAHIICQRYPKWIETTPEHFCGEYRAQPEQRTPDAK